VPALLSTVDIVVHPSLSEGVPNTLLEAMAAEKAIVASEVGGISEVVNTPEVGALIPPADSDALAKEISSLVSDERRRTQLGAAARSHVLSYFDRATNVSQIEDLCEQVAGSTSPIAPVVSQQLYDPPYALTARDHLLRA
jgi:glycosyltransferase involved in cell wall biosynthesis